MPEVPDSGHSGKGRLNKVRSRQREAARIVQVKLFDSLFFPPLYYSQLPWRKIKTIYNHLPLSLCVHRLFSLSFGRPPPGEDRQGKSVRGSGRTEPTNQKSLERRRDRPGAVSVTRGFKVITHLTVWWPDAESKHSWPR